ncbi:MAG: hypothetical protein NT027_13840 [Proteobacteria bacterium]|nr:hypothetical protein [Pseudomonadota bacterium]
MSDRLKKIYLLPIATAGLFASYFLVDLAVNKFSERNSAPSTQSVSKEDLLAPYLENLRMPQDKPLSNIHLPLANLGQQLFFDVRFSKNEQISCATCHSPEKSFTDGKSKSAGIAQTDKNAPTLIFVAQQKWFFHNGRADSLAAQALGPIENDKEHGFNRVRVAKIVDKYYRLNFEQIFGALPPVEGIQDIYEGQGIPSQKEPIQVSEAVGAFALATLGDKTQLKSLLAKAQRERTQPAHLLMAQFGLAVQGQTEFDRLSPPVQDSINQIFAWFGLAIAEFEKTIVTEASPFDQFATNFLQSRQLSQSMGRQFGMRELSGFELFATKAQCFQCHHGPLFSDQQFHNIGLPQLENSTLDLGRSVGLILSKKNVFNCKSSYFQHVPSKILIPIFEQITQSETCKESEFLDENESDFVGAFKTPTLRNLPDTAPYFHDGRATDLLQVLDFYDQPEAFEPSVGHRAPLIKNLNLSDSEKADLVAFLKSIRGQPRWGVDELNQ